jgi:hypothetical protein
MVVVTGGNIDPAILTRAISRGATRDTAHATAH